MYCYNQKASFRQNDIVGKITWLLYFRKKRKKKTFFSASDCFYVCFIIHFHLTLWITKDVVISCCNWQDSTVFVIFFLIRRFVNPAEEARRPRVVTPFPAPKIMDLPQVKCELFFFEFWLISHSVLVLLVLLYVYGVNWIGFGSFKESTERVCIGEPIALMFISEFVPGIVNILICLRIFFFFLIITTCSLWNELCMGMKEWSYRLLSRSWW